MRPAEVARWLLALWLGAAFACQAATPVLLAQDAWVEEGTQATIAQVAGPLAGRLQPTAGQAVHPLGPGRTLWLRLKLQRPAGGPADWGLDLPVPLLDSARLYQRNAQGAWEVQTAGDAHPVAAWSRPGRYPSFDLELPAGAVREVYLQVRHSDPIGFALRIGPARALEQTRQTEYLVLGMLLGPLILLTASCLILGGLHRDPSYGWYALYAAAMTLTMASVTGVSAHLLWNESPRWADLAQGVLPVALAGVHLLFLRHLCGVGVRYPRVDRLALGAGAAILGLALLFFAVDAPLQSLIVAVSLLTALVLGFVLAGLAWRRHDMVGAWVVLAYVPLALTIAVALLRLFGVVAAGWLTLDASAAATALAVPLLLLALNARSRDRLGVRTRVNKLTEQDALTGLLSAPAFERQLQATVSGALMRREPAAVVLVELLNLPQIRRFHGDAMAEQCLLRGVIKLHRVMRESDPAGRIDTARFALILEGVRTREQVQARMVGLVASGLVPARGAKLEIPLQFHAACLLLGEQVLTPPLILRDLGRLLSRMARHTRRPIQFLEPRARAEVAQAA